MNYAQLRIVEACPNGWHAPEGCEDVFRRLAGATILRIGSPDSEPDDGVIEGGGLVIDYRLPSDPKNYRVVFAFNECGMWLILDSYAAHDPIAALAPR
jgi:hypothetical protein